MVERKAGPLATMAQGLLAALDQHRRGEKDQAGLAYKKAVAGMQPVGENPLVRELVREALREFGTDGPEADMLLAAAAGEPPAAIIQAIQNQPNEAAGYLARGEWYGRRGLCRKAADDYSATYRLQPDPLTGKDLGILLVRIGKADSYGDHCKALLDRFAETSKNHEAEWTLKTCCLLGPGPVGEPARLARLAEVTVSGDPAQQYREWQLLAHGLYEYRAKRYDAAVTNCREARSKAKDADVNALTAAVFAVEAMALHRSGDAEGARRSLTEAKKLIDERLGVLHGGDSGEGWYDWLAAQLLYREAEGLLGGKKEEPK